MALLQCEMCCGELEISPDKSVGICKYCGSTYTIPKEIEKKGNLFNRANYLRQTCNFDKAINVYESILAENCEDADALWGLVLCRYGIEFVEDPKTKARIPTCHRASRTSILLDPDFKSAMQYADDEKKQVYFDNASRIDQIQKAILSMSDTQEKYDVFICYKESDDQGERTIDSVLAQELYNELTKMKIKTFFARKTLEGKVGSSYEPIIYSALNSAKVMVVLGTKPEYFEATWVKNEWSRYLDFMKDTDEKHLIPAYRDMSAYQLPEEFMSIQAVDMARIGFMLDLCDGIKKLLRKDERVEEVTAAPISKEALYSRAMVFLGNREFYKAVDYFDKVLDIDPQYARAYWGSLLASYQCVTASELINCTADDWTDDARLKNAMQFASEEEKNIYQDTLIQRIQNFKKLANVSLEKREFDKCRTWCEKYLSHDSEDGSMWQIKLLADNNACNSNELFENCLENTVFVEETVEYKNILAYSIPEESMMFEKTVAKITLAVSEKSRALAYEECRNYMTNSIGNLRREQGTLLSNQWKNHQQEAEVLRIMKNSKGKFFNNNIFSFLLQCLFWATPIYIAAIYLMTIIELSELFFNTFFALFGAIMLLVVFIKLCIYISSLSRASQMSRDCHRATAKMEGDNEAISQNNTRLFQTQSILKQFLANPDLSIEQVEAYKTQFKAAYECFENDQQQEN